MNAETEKYLALLEKRLMLLRALSRQLLDCRKEFVAMDLDGMYSRMTEQEELCRQIQSLHPAIDSLQRKCAAHLGLERREFTVNDQDGEWPGRLSGVLQELKEAQTEVGRLSQIHAAYLRRSGRTIQVLLNFVGNYAITYARPEPTMSAASRHSEKG